MIRICLLLLGLVAASPSLSAQDPADMKPAKKVKLPYTVGKKTTFLEGPFDKDGRIDYEAALNELMSKGVTPENNANVLLAQVFGPKPLRVPIPQKHFQMMKIAAPLEKGAYFVEWYRHYKDAGIEVEDGEEQLEQAMTRPWTVQEFPALATWLTVNEKPLAIAIEASKRKRFYNPIIRTSRDGEPGAILFSLPLSQVRSLACALTARAMLRVNEKKCDHAWQDLLACHRLGRAVANGGTLIDYLVGIAMDAMATEQDIAFLEAADFESTKLERCLADLQELPPFPPMAIVLTTERLILLDTLAHTDLLSSSILMPFKADGSDFDRVMLDLLRGEADRDPALRQSNLLFEQLQSAIKLDNRAARMKAFADLERDAEKRRDSAFDLFEMGKWYWFSRSLPFVRGKAFGDFLAAPAVGGYRKVYEVAEISEQYNLNLKTAFALAVYKREHGSYPKTLDLLAPKYLAKAPHDHFSGRELIYRPTAVGFTVYSVGKNERDDGGQAHGDDPQGDDIVVRLPRPKRKAESQ